MIWLAFAYALVSRGLRLAKFDSTVSHRKAIRIPLQRRGDPFPNPRGSRHYTGTPPENLSPCGAHSRRSTSREDGTRRSVSVLRDDGARRREPPPLSSRSVQALAA